MLDGTRGSRGRRRAAAAVQWCCVHCSSSRAQRPLVHAASLAVCLCLATPFASHAQDVSFGPDKVLHFGASAVLTVGGYGLGVALDDGPDLRFGLAFAVPLAAGFGKEIFDAAFGGDPSWADLGWDLLGTLAGLVVVGVIEAWLSPGAAPTRASADSVRSALALPPTVRAPRSALARPAPDDDDYFFLVKYRPNGSAAKRLSRW